MSKTQKILQVFVLLVVSFFAIAFISRNYSSFENLTIDGLFYLPLLAVLFLATYICISVSSKTLLSSLSISLGHVDSFLISLATGFYNLITPFRGGMAFRAMYLKKRFRFAYTDFLAIVAASYVVIFLVSALIGIFATVWIYRLTSVFSWLLFLVFVLTALVMLIIIVFAPRFNEPRQRWLGKVVRVINGWHLIRHDKRVIFVIAALAGLQIILSSLMLVVQFKVIGVSISFAAALFLSAVGSLAILVAITPAGIGVNEAITVFSALTIGINPAQSLSAAILGRLVSVIILFIAGPVSSYYLLRKTDLRRRNVKRS